jgi:hypothetical protein
MQNNFALLLAIEGSLSVYKLLDFEAVILVSERFNIWCASF